jgi:hypothetical protein
MSSGMIMPKPMAGTTQDGRNRTDSGKNRYDPSAMTEATTTGSGCSPCEILVRATMSGSVCLYHYRALFRHAGTGAFSSVGRAPRLHRGCHRFEPGRAHPVFGRDFVTSLFPASVSASPVRPAAGLRSASRVLQWGIATADIFRDKVSGACQSRPGLDALLQVLRPGNSITVQAFDRLGRSSLHVFQTLQQLEDKGVEVSSVKGSEQQFSGATGRFLRDVLILAAEFERSMNAEPVAEARAARAARAEAGEQVAGRPRTALTAEKIQKVKKVERERS